jgi:UDP-glucuronate decarboxylase
LNYNLSVIREECKTLCERIKIDELKNLTILITGANGLIGGFLSDFFCYINDEYDANCTIYLTSYSLPSNVTRIKHLLNRSDVKYFSWDSSEQIKFSNLSGKIDKCFFCSGYGQPSKFLKNNVKTSMINVVGVESILNYMNSNLGGDFIFLSTSEIYGNPPSDKIPTPETYGGEYELGNNRAAYKVSKCLGEVICKEYNKADNMNVKIARVALTYGPGVLWNDKRVLQEFIFKAAEGDIKMVDGGESLRNYLYITDSVELILNISKGKNMVYNVGSDSEEVSIYDLALKIAENFNSKVIRGESKIEATMSAPKGVCLDMTKVKSEFSFFGSKTTSLSDGIRQVIKWYNLGRNND